VSDAKGLFVQYLRQQGELGAMPLVLSGQRQERQESTPSAVPPAAAASPDPGPAWMKGAPPIPGPGLTITAPTKDLFAKDSLADASLEEIAEMVRTCTRCPLHASRTNGVPGEGPSDARLMVVGEGPGANEDETGRPFVGRAGQLLDEILAAIGCPRETVFIANIVKSRPPNNRKPEPLEIEACLPYLYRQIEIIHPAVILAMGGTAAESLLGTRGSLGTFRNKVHSFRGIPLVVTYHPAALLRNPHWKRPTWDDVRIARQLLDE